MKKLILLLVFLVSCVPVAEASTDIPTLETQSMNCDVYFNSWEIAKRDQVATGQYWYLAKNEAMVFLTTEEAGLHEIGHFVDMERGYPSQNEAFRNVVHEYVYNPPANVQDELHHYLFVVIEQSMYDDAYAQLYMWNILYDLPIEFEEFFK